eukprot:15539-Heterococcus_DN1.PRE.4
MYMLTLARAFTGAPRALALKSCTLSCKRSYSRAQSLAMAAATTTEPQVASSVPAIGAATDANSHVPLLLRHNRGFFHQCTDLQGLDKKLCEGTGADVSAYLGFDATADSLHVGSLTQIMILRHLQSSSHAAAVAEL